MRYLLITLPAIFIVSVSFAQQSIIGKWSSKGDENIIHEWTFSKDSSFFQSVRKIGDTARKTRSGIFHFADSSLTIVWSDKIKLNAVVKFTRADKMEVQSPDEKDPRSISFDIYRRE